MVKGGKAWVPDQPLLIGHPGLAKRVTALPGSPDSEYYLRSAELIGDWCSICSREMSGYQ